MSHSSRLELTFRPVLLLLSAFLGSGGALAHHSFAAEFDIDRPVDFRGKVVKVELINPHSWIHLEVSGKNGATEIWMIEGGSPNQLVRRGFTKNTLPIGAELQVVGYQSRDGAKRAVGRTLKFADGKSLFFDTTPIPAAPAAAPATNEGISATALAERLKRWRTELPQGTGPHRVARLVEPDNPGYTVYRPADLKRSDRLPVVAFANGACRNTSLEYAGFLSELASHGYLIVAVGRDDNPFEIGPDAPQVLDVEALTGAVDWAVARNDDAASAYHGRLRPDRIAYMGHSCGGMQALTASADPRTTTTVVLNSGYYRTPPAKPPGPLPEYRRWSELRAPTALFTGGPKDVAYRIARDSYEDGVAANLPMFLASLPAVAHSGAYVGPDRDWSRAVLAWLDWQLKGDDEARAQFVGGRCGLCTNPAWRDAASHGLK